MRKFSPSQLGIISESDNIFRIRVVVSDLNLEYLDNSEFFSRVIRTMPNFFLRSIRSIRTILNFFLEFRTDFRIICRKNMEIHQNPLFFHENIFFLIRKSPNTPNSIFQANIRNLLLRGSRSIFSYIDRSIFQYMYGPGPINIIFSSGFCPNSYFVLDIQ